MYLHHFEYVDLEPEPDTTFRTWETSLGLACFGYVSPFWFVCLLQHSGDTLRGERKAVTSRIWISVHVCQRCLLHLLFECVLQVNDALLHSERLMVGEDVDICILLLGKL